jgi:para-nitrobenzyl esterase
MLTEVKASVGRRSLTREGFAQIASSRLGIVPFRSPRRCLQALAAIFLTVLVVAGCGLGAPRAQQTSAGATAVLAADPGLAQGVVRTKAGAVRGLVGPNYQLFQGIPYAAPPVGPLRWQPPVPAPAWPGMFDASKPGVRCVQDTTNDPDFGRRVGEDCLNLNVWSPAGAAGRPVMVWIHGGAFINGSADLYDARRLATQGDIVVVTVNYRLGALGFLAHPALGAPGQVGNYGLQDQQAALRWVRDNIAGFGGDPGKVTIAGESAGGMSVCDHLVAPGSQGLFRAAIIQSGPCQAQAPLPTAEQSSLRYARSVGCPDPATAAGCLRKLPASALWTPPWYFHIGTDALTGPVTATPVLPVDPVAAISSGQAAPVPVLIGTNHDEFTLFTAIQYLRLGRSSSAAGYPKELSDTFGAEAPAVQQHYPLSGYDGNVAQAYSAAVTDGVFACLADRMAGALAGAAPVYTYEFNDPEAPAPPALRHVPFNVGAGHSLELPYLFEIGGASSLSPVQQNLSDQMIGYWSQFVSTGVPGMSGAPVWPPINDHLMDRPTMSFEPGGGRIITTFGKDHQCGFWAGLGELPGAR